MRLLPQQHQCHPRLVKLLVDHGPVGYGPSIDGYRRRGWKETPFQVGIAENLGQRPTQAGSGETPLVLSHTASGNLRTLAATCRTDNPDSCYRRFSSLTHGQTLHHGLLCSGKGFDHSGLCTASPPCPSGAAKWPRNQRQNRRGMLTLKIHVAEKLKERLFNRELCCGIVDLCL